MKNLCIFLLSIVLFVSGQTITHAVDTSNPKPTILLHGLNGGSDTYKVMKKSYEDINYAVGEVLVNKNGGIKTTKVAKVTKTIIHGPGNEDGRGVVTPLVVSVVFENNKDSIANQAKWVKKVLTEVKKTYRTNKVDIIAHSMGGLTATKYILDTGGNDIDTLITLDSPILGSKLPSFLNALKIVNRDLRVAIKSAQETFPSLVDLQINSKAIQDLYKRRSKFNKNIKVISWAATKNDFKIINTVSTGSAHGLQHFTKNIKLFVMDTNHSGIHDLPADPLLAYSRGN
ncbi:alpha/beta hydrolase [Bacillus sp. 31A1R]|uniref:Alpha/beta hydrolase n=1 Tax=Robertmurraya mangrovi TaxID=3098077 RepID=A0ABU5ITF3_9BACI|nr:alpha/beta hydrolase [Bacillus sp. 31A1R]MDZ5470406.1 alpha/beta hydrolase [Bacillus sp. 31A1R]